MSGETQAEVAERERLVGELSDLAIRIMEAGGAGALAASAGALAEGAAAAMPEAMIPGFCKVLIKAVASGARIAGHSVTVLDETGEEPTGRTH